MSSLPDYGFVFEIHGPVPDPDGKVRGSGVIGSPDEITYSIVANTKGSSTPMFFDRVRTEDRPQEYDLIASTPGTKVDITWGDEGSGIMPKFWLDEKPTTTRCDGT